MPIKSPDVVIKRLLFVGQETLNFSRYLAQRMSHDRINVNAG